MSIDENADIIYSRLVQYVTDGDLDALRGSMTEINMHKGYNDPQTGFSLLHVAVSMRRTAIMSFLLTECGFDPLDTVQDTVGDTCFHLATRTNQVECMEVLAVPEDSRWLETNALGQAAFHTAVQSDAAVALTYLAPHPGLFTAKDTKRWTVLHYLALVASTQLLDVLLTRSPTLADLGAADQAGRTAAHYLAINSGAKAVEWSVVAHVDDAAPQHHSAALIRLLGYASTLPDFGTLPFADLTGTTPAHFAVLSFPPPTLPAVLGVMGDAMLNAVNRKGFTPLMLALGRGPDAGTAALECDLVNPLVATDIGSALTLAVGAGDVDNTCLLLDVAMATLGISSEAELAAPHADLSAWLSAGDRSGATALHMACRAGLGEVVRLILCCGANAPIMARDAKGDPPIALALRRGHYDIVTAFLDVPADLKPHVVDSFSLHDAERWTACHHLVKIADIYLLEQFIAFCGARFNPNPVTRDGMTPLHMAVLDGNADMARLLVGRGAEPYPTIDGHYPVHLAIVQDDVELFWHLLKEQHSRTLPGKLYTRVEPRLSLVELAVMHCSWRVLLALRDINTDWGALVTCPPIGLMVHECSVLDTEEGLAAIDGNYKAETDKLWSLASNEETAASAEAAAAAEDALLAAQLFVDSMSVAETRFARAVEDGTADEQYDRFVRTFLSLVLLLRGSMAAPAMASLLALDAGLWDICISRPSILLLGVVLAFGADPSYLGKGDRTAAHVLANSTSAFTRYGLPLVISQGGGLDVPNVIGTTPLVLLSGGWSCFGFALHEASATDIARRDRRASVNKDTHKKRGSRPAPSPPPPRQDGVIKIIADQDEARDIVIGPAPAFRMTQRERPEFSHQPTCAQCGRRFGVLTRRTHCRACGNVFCTEHVKDRVTLPWSTGPVKVCRTCRLLAETQGGAGAGGSP